jgi:HAD superfamily hydrolase (TIGR01509 family)
MAPEPAEPVVPVELVLFDLGGVLIEPGGIGPMRELSGIGSDEEVWARWLSCRWVRSFEAGRCSAEAFAAGVVADWRLGVTPDWFLEAFGTWPRGPYPGAAELVDQVRTSVPVGCLSNTNAYQWRAHYAGTPLVDAFDHRFLSFELGMVKPDRAIFEVVAGRLPVARDRVLFLDDNAANVDAAADSGFATVRVQGLDQTRSALTTAGVAA